jgi:hypothetical protein
MAQIAITDCNHAQAALCAFQARITTARRVPLLPRHCLHVPLPMSAA